MTAPPGAGADIYMLRDTALRILAREKTAGLIDGWYVATDGRVLVAIDRDPPPPDALRVAEDWPGFIDKTGTFVREVLTRQPGGELRSVADALASLGVERCIACSNGKITEHYECAGCDHQCSAPALCHYCDGLSFDVSEGSRGGEFAGAYLDRRLLAVALSTCPDAFFYATPVAPVADDEGTVYDRLYLWADGWRGVVMGMKR